MDTQRNEQDALIAFACPGCGHAMKARASYAGRATRCPKCQASVTVPAPEARRTPAANKSSVGVFLAIGVLLLAGGLLTWMLTPGKDDIDDLALVPPNAQGVVCIKFDALWQTPAVQKAATNYRRANPGQDLARRLETETGLTPDQIERLTVVVTNAAKEEGWAIVRTKQPFDAEAIRERVREAPVRRFEFAEGAIDPENPLAFEAVSPRVFVIGKDGGVRQALDQLRVPVPTPGPLGPIIERCRRADHVVFGYNPAAGSIDGSKLGIDLSVLNDVDVFLGTLNVREQAELEIRARTGDAAKAEKLHVATTGWLKMAKFGLAFAQFDPGEKGKQAKQISKLLGAIKLDVDDKDVVATLKTDADAAIAQLLGAIP